MFIVFARLLGLNKNISTSDDFKFVGGKNDNSDVTQVEDNPELLDLMVSDQEAAEEMFHSAARWKGYSEDLIGFIKKNSLKDFRCVKDRDEEGARGFRSFGSIDLLPRTSRFSPETLMKNTLAAVVGKKAKKIQGAEEVRNIALISSNQDHNIADVITEIYNRVGLNGAISIQEGSGFTRDT